MAQMLRLLISWHACTYPLFSSEASRFRPNLPSRQALFNRLMKSKAIEKVIEDEAKSKSVPIEKVRKEAHAIMDEIAANFSYSLIKNGERYSAGCGIVFTKA